MPLRDLLVSFLAAAIASLVFCMLKIAFDSIAAASARAFRLHRPTGASTVPESMLKGPPRKKGLRVSFEGGAELRQDRGARSSLDPGEEARIARESNTGWEAAAQNGLLQRRSGGRKLSVVPEE